MSEDARVDHRRAAAQLPRDQAGENDDRGGQAGQRADGQPPLGGRLDDRVHESDHADDGQDGAADVEAGVSRSADSGASQIVPAMAAAASTTFSPNTAGHDHT